MTGAFPPEIARLVDSIYPPARQALADSFAGASRRLFAVDALVQLALIAAFSFTGAARWLRDRISHLLGAVGFSRPFVVACVLTLCAIIGFSVITLPLDWYGSFVLRHEFGLSRETAQQWFRDYAVGLALFASIAAVLAGLFVVLVRALPRRWPLVVGAAALPLILIASAVFPVFIAPLFNSFRPMPKSQLSDAILALAHAQDIDADVVFVYDMSRQSTEADAYVAGIGRTERIAVGDNLLAQLAPDEVLYVLAHEMGHYKLGHLWIGAFLSWLDALVLVAIVCWVGGAIARKRGEELSDPAALPLIALIIFCYGLVTAPVSNAISRRIEHAADAFAAAHTRLGDAGVRAFARLANEDLSPLHPPPFVVWYFYTHPPMDERIMFAAARAGVGRVR